MATAILACARPHCKSGSSFVPGQSLLKMKDAAELAGVSVELLRYYANCGTVETERTVGGHRLVKRDSLVRALGLNIDDPTEDTDAERSTVLYARVSTDKQRQEGNLTRQIERLERYAAENYPGQTSITIGEVGSGLNHERRGFVRMIEMVLSGRVKRIVCEFADRISRNCRSLVYRLCERSGVEIVETRPTEGVTDEERQKTENEELAFELIAVTTCFCAKVNGKRGGMVNKFAVSDATRTRILALHESGHSYRDICRVIKREGHADLNHGRAVKEHNIRAILLAYARDRRKSGNDAQPKPQTVEAFVARHCERGNAADPTCRVFARPLYLSFVRFCQAERQTPLSRVEFSKAFQSVTGCSRQRHSTKRDFYAGIKLPSCPRSAITHKAMP
jgi:predicted site-specific integrase-resolvase